MTETDKWRTDLIEKRREQRHPAVRFVWFKVLDGDKAADQACEGMARSCDISQRGVGLVLSAPIAKGKRVFVEIATQKGSLSLLGLVRFCGRGDGGDHHVGVEIEIMPPNDRLLWARLLST